jgi:hypothetical protein
MILPRAPCAKPRPAEDGAMAQPEDISARLRHKNNNFFHYSPKIGLFISNFSDNEQNLERFLPSATVP